MSKMYEFLKHFVKSLEDKVKEIDPETRVLISYANIITTIDKFKADDLEYLTFTISTDKRYDTCLRSMITETRQHVYDGFGGYIEYNGEQIDVEVAYVVQGYDDLIIIHISDSFNKLMKNFDKMYEVACNTKFEYNDVKEAEGKFYVITHSPDGLLLEGVDSNEIAEEIFEDNAQGDEA